MNGVKVFPGNLKDIVDNHFFKKKNNSINIYDFNNEESITAFIGDALDFHKNYIKNKYEFGLDNISLKTGEKKEGLVYPQHSDDEYYLCINLPRIKKILEHKKREPFFKCISLVEYSVIKSYFHNSLYDLFQNRIIIDHTKKELFGIFDPSEKENNINIKKITRFFGRVKDPLSVKYIEEYCSSARKELEKRKNEDNKTSVNMLNHHLNCLHSMTSKLHSSKSMYFERSFDEIINFIKHPDIIDNLI
ncbi:hypothetical protein JW949_03655 [Candidatus Woesearchaeota archaeon]|nr:hypothetical protein [Candidatus Woesearchaeota archaeon]